MTEGEVFDELRPAYTICFIDSKLFHRKPEVYLNRFGAFDPATGEVMSNHFNVYIVELPKFVRGANEVGTTLESWCYYFEHGASLDPEHLPATLDRPPVRKAMEVLMRMSQDAIERDRYESRLKYRRDMQQFERDAATAMERGEEKGRKEGRKAGREEGELYGEIRTFQLVLKQPQTPKQDLEKMSLDELQRLAVELQRQVNSGK